MSAAAAKPAWTVAVGLGSCGVAAGAQALFQRAQERLDPAAAALVKTGCAGLCYLEPMLELYDPAGRRFTYVQLTPDLVDRIVTEHIGRGAPVEALLLTGPDRAADTGRFLGKQKKIVLENCGLIDPESLEASLAAHGYEALRKVLAGMTSEAVIAEITASGLRGRGGAGFSTGAKWKFAAAAPGPDKYIVCNADEGDPGAFMDRSVLESDPHRVLEGMLIAGYAIGAPAGFIYARAEYPLAIARLERAIAQARAAGFLGEGILGTPFRFDLQIREGAGAFVCGEETALMRSIEGERGMPRLRPPFPAQKGLWGKPTSINNVETFANVPWIIRHGAAAFAAMGTEKSKGTKVFALAGKIRRGGLVEVPMGITLREIVEDVGGGSPTGRPVKAIQTGGPSGGCIPRDLFDTRVDYEELGRTGAIMGSGGMVVMDETSCMVDIARYFLTFTARESCGKCTFCRVGTTRMLEILTRITEGKSSETELALLEELAAKVKATSLCGLGQTAPNPVLTTLRYFRSEYEAHIRDRRCPAKACKALLTYSIDPESCVGCTACARVCPVKAITGERKKAHALDPKTCIRCGACEEACKFDAVKVE
jgi:NADH-quinone oxidoreductase subunit F